MNKKHIQFFAVALIGWIFIIYEYAVRVSDSVILPQLQQIPGVQASQLGILSSGYYFAYIATMIPAGILIDRYGLFRSWLAATLLLITGCFLFGSGLDIYTLVVARALMGAGSAFYFVGLLSFVLCSPRAALLMGVTMGACMTGAIVGQGPWLQLTYYFGHWQTVYIAAGFFGSALFVIWMIFFKKACRDFIPLTSSVQIKKSFITLASSPMFWVLALFIGCLSTPQTAFMALWGPQFLSSMHVISASQAAYVNSLISVGGFLGALVLGYMGDIWPPKKLLACCSLVAAICMVLIIQGVFNSLFIVAALLLALGFVTNANVIVFAYLGRKFSTLPSTTVQSTTNMFNMGGGPVFQLLIGFGITLQTHGVNQELTAEMMQKPLWLIPLGLLIMTAVLLFTSFRGAHVSEK